jgi:hypothetical protein
MTLNDLLTAKQIPLNQTLVLRHRPTEPELRKVLPWLAAEKPDVFNAYQQTQGERVEKAMGAAKYVASCIGHEPGKALFIGLYTVEGDRPLTYKQYWEVPAYKEMKEFGMKGFSTDEGRPHVLWFDLQLTDFYAEWKGKLIVSWPPPELAWFRWAHRNEMAVHAVLEESLLDKAMPDWDVLTLRWEELKVLPKPWKAALAQWRGIYYIFDTAQMKGYVGSACGRENVLGRWQNYAASGHGGNKLLRQCDPQNLRFSILQRVSPDMEAQEVVSREVTWKERLHTRAPFGLNEN